MIVHSAAQEDAGATSRQGRIALTAVCLGFLLVLFDATAVTVATGGISEALHASPVQLQWILNAYTVAFAACMLIAGSVGDRWGSRRLYLVGCSLFAFASAACAAAPTPAFLIPARALQGLGAAAVVPCSLALLSHRFPAGSARSRALGVWGGVSGIGLAAGPVAGGALVSLSGWRSVFLVVVPFAMLSLVLTARHLPETPLRPSTHFDLPGSILSTAALVVLVGALTETSAVGWTSPWVVGPLALTAVFLALFLVAERCAADPMLPRGLFGDRAFRGATSIGLLFNFGLYGTLFCVALALERGLRVSSSTAGLALLPLTAVVALGGLYSSRLSRRLGARATMVAGLTGGLAGSTLLAVIGDHASVLGLAGVGAVLGLVGFAMPAMTGVALDAAGTGRAALGAAALNAARQTGGALGVALLGSTALGPLPGTISVRVPTTIAATAYLAALVLTVTTIPDPSAEAGRRSARRADH